MPQPLQVGDHVLLRRDMVRGTIVDIDRKRTGVPIYWIRLDADASLTWEVGLNLKRVDTLSSWHATLGYT